VCVCVLSAASGRATWSLLHCEGINIKLFAATLSYQLCTLALGLCW
jgi:hypothetical protein